jgi:hypothetical protein
VQARDQVGVEERGDQLDRGRRLAHPGVVVRQVFQQERIHGRHVERRGQVRAEHLGRRDDAVGDRRDGGTEERAEAARPERDAEDVVAAPRGP